MPIGLAIWAKVVIEMFEVDEEFKVPPWGFGVGIEYETWEVTASYGRRVQSGKLCFTNLISKRKSYFLSNYHNFG